MLLTKINKEIQFFCKGESPFFLIHHKYLTPLFKSHCIPNRKKDKV